MQGEGAAFVDAVVEHQFRPGITDQQVLVLPLSILQAARARSATVHDPRLLGPDPFGIAGEAFVQPDVPPRGRSQRIPEPLVGQFVGDQPLRFPVLPQWLRPKMDRDCASSGISRASSVTTTV